MTAPANTYAPDYSQWPTAGDVILCLDSAGITLRPSGRDRIPAVRNHVIREVSQKTYRQFIADTVDTTRTYNGQGTAEIEVDDMVSLTSVNVVGYSSVPAYSLSGAALIVEQGKSQNRIVVGRGSLAALTSEGILFPYPAVFPSGRQNIQVTGKFGYAAIIPENLWNAVCEEIAVRCGSSAVFTPDGRLVSWALGRQSLQEQYQVLPVEDAMLWHENYVETVEDLTRPVSHRIRNTRPPMI